jgi:hypothetical protein
LLLFCVFHRNFNFSIITGQPFQNFFSKKVMGGIQKKCENRIIKKT